MNVRMECFFVIFLNKPCGAAFAFLEHSNTDVHMSSEFKVIGRTWYLMTSKAVKGVKAIKHVNSPSGSVNCVLVSPQCLRVGLCCANFACDTNTLKHCVAN